MTERTLSNRELNRTTLARQLLLDRVAMPVADAVAHLVGLQAQVPQNPYVALWARLEAFDPVELERLLEGRDMVRMVTMRGTVHLLDGGDCRAIRRLTQPVMDAEIARHSEHKSRLVGVDMPAVLAVARKALQEAGALTNPELRDQLTSEFPTLHAAALGYACRCYLPLVQVPPRGLWSRSGTVRTAHADDWLEGRPDRVLTIDELVLRYLAAFGPASTADVSAWSRLTGLAEVTGRLDVRRYRDEHGRELLDLPDAAIVDAEAPARIAFLPEYDNALLSHKDRSRFAAPEAVRGFGDVQGPVHGTALVDGHVASVWRVDRDPETKVSSLVVTPVVELADKDLAELSEAAQSLAVFSLGPDADVLIAPRRQG